MFKFIRLRREQRAWQTEHDCLAPNEGDMAPDFELPEIHGEGFVRLSEFRGRKPVALIFGNYT
jgi:hypothetical protein